MDNTEEYIPMKQRQVLSICLFIIAAIFLLYSLISAGIQWIQVSCCTEITEGVVSRVITDVDYQFEYYEFEYEVDGAIIHAKELNHNRATFLYEHNKKGTVVTLQYDKDNPTNCVVVKEDWDKLYNRIDPYGLIPSLLIATSIVFFGLMLMFPKYKWICRTIAILCLVIALSRYEIL